MKVKSESEIAQSCPTLSDPMEWSLPGSSVHGIFQARVLEWGAIAFSNLLPETFSNFFQGEENYSRFAIIFHFLNYAYFIYDVAWRIPGMGEPGGLPSVGSHGVGHD